MHGAELGQGYKNNHACTTFVEFIASCVLFWCACVWLISYYWYTLQYVWSKLDCDRSNLDMSRHYDRILRKSYREHCHERT